MKFKSLFTTRRGMHSAEVQKSSAPLSRDGAEALLEPPQPLLTVGTLLKEGTYRVVEVLPSPGRFNRYVAERTRPVRVCPQCGLQVMEAQVTLCPRCGVDLSAAGERRLQVLVKEAMSAEAFATTAYLLQLSVEHVGLLLPLEIFEEGEDESRVYQVEPLSARQSASLLRVPQPLEKVLTWGIMLAQAMAYLHRHYVAVREVDADHVVIDAEGAHWARLEDGLHFRREMYTRAGTVFAQDAQALVHLLFYWMTGEEGYTSQTELPPAVAALFARLSAAPKRLTAEAVSSALEKVSAELYRSHNVIFSVGQRTDVGVERMVNEDSMLVLMASATFQSTSVPVGIFAVADGMGGHKAGDVASRLVIETIARQGWSRLLSPMFEAQAMLDASSWVTQAVLAANQALYTQRKATMNNMGSTLVLALAQGEKVTIANVGDSRAYHLSAAGVRQITTDHSLVEQLVAMGKITREEARVHPRRNVIYRMMGERLDVDVDLFEQVLAPGEALLLCSDGLSGMLEDETIWEIWHTSVSPQEACDRLVDAANQAGGSDNIAVILVQICR